MKIGVRGEGGKILLQFRRKGGRHVAAFFVIFVKFSLNARKENRRIRRRRVMKMSSIGEGAE
jgi:hypothetical protein